MKFIKRLFLEIIFFIQNYLNDNFNKKVKNPSLLAYNIVWFTNCSWLQQIIAFDQLFLYSYKK